MNDEIRTDVAIVGAGIAGAGLAADLAGDHDVVMIERESRPGYHSTGRSAAVFIQNYGNATIRALTRASAPLFMGVAEAEFPTPLLKQRGVLHVADDDSLPKFRELVAGGEGLRELTADEAVAMVPILRKDVLRGAAYEADAQDIDVDALHQGWLRKGRAAGVRLLTDAPVTAARFEGGAWLLETPKGRVRARVLVNAAGAWADVIARMAGIAPLGIQPMRRTIGVLPPPEGHDMKGWPLIDDAAERWYAKPESGRLLVSPADEEPVEPHDAFVDDMVLAEGLYRFEQATTCPVTRVQSSWAGLRSFAPDRTPVAGFDPTSENFFWLAGQGGYGIQTAPALSRLAGELVRRATPSKASEPLIPALAPGRFCN
jgi:D-arginine dehydrogenase